MGTRFSIWTIREAFMHLDRLQPLAVSGDEMNCELLLDQKELKSFSRLAPHMGVLDTHAPFRISGNIKLPGPTMSTIVSWMHMDEE